MLSGDERESERLNFLAKDTSNVGIGCFTINVFLCLFPSADKNAEFGKTKVLTPQSHIFFNGQY